MSCFKSSQPSYNTSIHLFDHVVKPVLMYAAEIWGCDRITKKNSIYNFMINDTLEKCHLKYLRYSLGVNKRAPNLAVYGDCGRFPLAIEATIHTIKYLQRLFNCNESDNTLLYNTFHESCKLTSANSWFHKVSVFLSRMNISVCDIANININVLIRKVKSLLQSTFIKSWKSELYNDNRKGEYGNKLRTYRKFKTTFSKEWYLTECQNITQ